MLDAFASNFSKKNYENARKSIEERAGVYCSLQRFIRDLKHSDINKKTFVILDSCDTVYNTIAQLKGKNVAENLRKQFTSFLSVANSEPFSDVVTICFGVSPHLASELRKDVDAVYNVSDKSTVGKYFSYNEETIKDVCTKFGANHIAVTEKCRKIAEFKFMEDSYLNPAICVNYLRCSLDLKESHFYVDIAPRSLWLNCIFTVEDKDLLLDVLRGPCQKEFTLNVGMKSIIKQMQKTGASNRKLFYPMFIFGGFLSCDQYKDAEKKPVRGQYVINVANQTARCLMRYYVRSMYVSLFPKFSKFPMHSYIFEDKWEDFCRGIKWSIEKQSYTEEKRINDHLCGGLSFGVTENYIVSVENNVTKAGIIPDRILW